MRLNQNIKPLSSLTFCNRENVLIHDFPLEDYFKQQMIGKILLELRQRRAQRHND
jgi:hypothetical protein